MIYRLRRRFFAIAFFSLLFVLAAITAFINLWNLSSMIGSADDTLTLIIENNGYFPRMPKDKMQDHGDMRKMPFLEGGSPPGGKFDRSPEAPFSTRYFSVTLDQEGNDLSVNTGNIAAITTETASEMASEVALSGHERGFYGVYRYMVSQKEDKTQVVFLDCRRELMTSRDFLVISLSVDGVGLVAVSVLILLFSKVAVRPVAESYEKQKRFITDAGHELKTPLAIIATNVDVLELEAGESQWTQSIRNQVARMAKLTGDLTRLASMEEAERQFTMEQLDFSALVREAVQGMEPLVSSRGKALEAHIEPERLLVGNREALQQLVTILLDNAIKYSVPDEQITLSLCGQNKSVLLTVRNRTRALSDGKQDQLFERFYRADASRSRETGGHGLGLSIAKAIVTAHKGKICAECLDAGAFVITVKLPV